jgi:(p)ppGpp synthase/HD superfamily hydrolase
VPNLEDALRLAVEAHYGATDRYGEPYILHPLRVMHRVDTEAEKMAAILHDVIEDTPHTLEDLRQAGYAVMVVDAVDALTRREDETYVDYVERLSPCPIARRVKIADLEDNMDIRRMSHLHTPDAERLERYRSAWVRLTGRNTVE